jgi:hypothetical protein
MQAPPEQSVCSSAVLHILRNSDKLRRNFDRWSTDRRQEMLLLSINLKKDAVIDGSLVAQLHLLFPCRLCGPFLQEHTMTVEILEDPSNLDLLAPLSVEDDKLRVKRAKMDGAACASIDIQEIAEVMKLCIARTNNSLCTLDGMRTGKDDVGIWVCWNLRPVGRVNLSFISLFKVQDCATNVKEIQVRVYEEKELFVRLFDPGERRMISSWEVVPVYKDSGVFLGVRSVLQRGEWFGRGAV